MSCHEIAPLLELVPLLLDDEDEGLLEAHERTALDQHLRSCATCRQHADALSAAYGREAETVEDTMQPLSPELRERVLADAIKDAKSAPTMSAVDPAAVEALRGKIGLSCSFCHDKMERVAAVFCASCLAPHHGECFQEHGRCSLPGCAETRTVRPSEADSPPRRKAGVVISLAVALATGGAVAAAALFGDPPTTAEAVRQAEPDELLGDTEIVFDADPGTDGGVLTPEAERERVEEFDGPPAVIAVGKSGPGRVTIDCQNADLADVAIEFSDHGEGLFLVDPNVRERVSLSLVDIPVREAVDVIARMCRCEVEARSGGIFVFTQPPRVTIQFTDADVRTVFRLCAAYSGQNLVLGPGVTGTVSVDFQEEHWRRAVHAIAANGGLHVAEPRPGLVLVTASALPERVLGWFDRHTYKASLDPPAGGEDAARRAERDAIEAEGVTLDFVDVELSDACEQLGRLVGRNILVDPSVAARVTLRVKKIHWLDAVDALATLGRCELEFRPGGIVLFTQPPALTLNLANCPAQALYRMLGARAGWNVVVSRGVTGLFSGDLRKLHVGEALLALAAVHGHEVAQEGNVVSITPGDWGTPPSTTQIDLAEDERRVAEVLNEIRRFAAARDAEALEAKQAELRALIAGEAVAAPARDEEAIASCLAAVEERLAELSSLLVQTNQDEVVAALTALRGDISAYTAVESDVSRQGAQLEEWSARFADDELGLSVRLQLAITVGNAHLRGMREAIADERIGEALAAEERIRSVVRSLRANEHQVMHNNADALEQRAQALGDRARVLRRIEGADLRVQAVLDFGGTGDSPDEAIVSGWHAVQGQDLVGAGEPETGIEVVEIGPASVRFRLGATEFVREVE